MSITGDARAREMTNVFENVIFTGDLTFKTKTSELDGIGKGGTISRACDDRYQCDECYPWTNALVGGTTRRNGELT